MEPALILTRDRLQSVNAKTAHGLLRVSRRFRIIGVVDEIAAGRDAGEVLDGEARGIPVFASLNEALAGSTESPKWCVVGIATHGGRISPDLRTELKEAIGRGLSVVNGLHDFVSDDSELVELAAERGVEIVDVRRAPPRAQLHFWTGEIHRVRAPRVAVLGTDCAIGKRTTARMLADALGERGVRAEMIYTGQTGWMQGADYGFVFDSVPNDFVCGELEHAIVSCDREAKPDVILLEGQSSLRNPSGPAGAEFLLAAAANGVVLQHAAGRTHFEGYEELDARVPDPVDEMKLIAAYGVPTLALALSGQNTDAQGLCAAVDELSGRAGIPVCAPLVDGPGVLVETVVRWLEEVRS